MQGVSDRKRRTQEPLVSERGSRRDGTAVKGSGMGKAARRKARTNREQKSKAPSANPAPEALGSCLSKQKLRLPKNELVVAAASESTTAASESTTAASESTTAAAESTTAAAKTATAATETATATAEAAAI
jgi:hypothetical protein